MNQLIGCCGLDYETCDARIATITNDNALREKTAVVYPGIWAENKELFRRTDHVKTNTTIDK